MIPATQRPDGTWRKARKIRTGFSSNSGGATRYVPPAFRNTGGGGGDGGGDKDEDGGRADDRTSTIRSLGEVAAADCGRRGSSRFLSAALFLLTATPASSATATTTEQSGPRRVRRDTEEDGSSRSGGAGTSGGRSTSRSSSVLGAAARAAKDRLGCNDCLHLAPETECVAAAAAADGGGITKSREESTGYSSGGQTSDKGRITGSSTCTSTSTSNRGGREEQTGRSSDSSSSSPSNGWWSRLRQAERGWIASDTGPQEGSTTTVTAAGEGWGGESWAGLELQLRPSDLCSPDGQAAIVDFLKGRVGAGHRISRQDNEAQEGGKRGGGDESARSPEEIRPPESTEPTEPTAVVPVIGESTMAAGGGGGGGGDRRDLSISSSSSSPGRSKVGGAVSAATDDAGAAQERGGSGYPDQAQERKEPTVLLAVLVFGSELSKRERAELHGHAEKTDGVASSSHGVADGRFLSLTYGFGSRAATAKLELSAEKAEFARRLFRLAQQEYHSRYECLSHGEIREVVALGGPNARDHPDLFRLVEKHQHQRQQNSSITDQPSPGDGISNNTMTNKAAAASECDTGSAITAAALEWTASEQACTSINPEKTKQQHQHERGVGVRGGVAKSKGALSAADGKIAEEEQPSLSVRGKQCNEPAVVYEEDGGGVELKNSRQKCPW